MHINDIYCQNKRERKNEKEWTADAQIRCRRYFHTSIRCSWLTDWCCTDWPLISRISSPTCSVACRCIIPPCIIRATMHRPSSVIFSVMPWISEKSGNSREKERQEDRDKFRWKCKFPNKSSLHARCTITYCAHCLWLFTAAIAFKITEMIKLTIGSSVFFWNCTNRTRVTCCWSSPFSTLSLSSPLI